MEELNHRFLPSSIEAESGILSVALNDPAGAYKACSALGLRKEHFYHPGTSLLYGVLYEFWEENEPIDMRLITHHLRKMDLLTVCGGRIGEHQSTGAAYISELYTLNTFPGHLPNYVEIVKSAARRRRSILRLQGAVEAAYDQSMDDIAFYGEAESVLLEIVKMQEGGKIHSRDMRELVMRAMDRIDRRVNGDWKIEMSTGIKALDAATMGFIAPMVTAIAGKPSDGKSSLAMNIAEHLAIDCGKRVGIISLDDSDDQVADRMIQQLARVNLWEIKKTGQLSDWDRDKLTSAGRILADASDRLFIRDDGGLTPAEISATFATWASRQGLDFGIIDHIQLAKGDGNTRGKTEEAEQVSRTLKPMAKRFGIPLLVLSQVTKQSDGSYNTKNSLALQEDANNLWAIARDAESTDAWIHISKQKDGPRNESVPVTFHGYCTRFTDRGTSTPDQPNLVELPPAAKKGRK